LRAAFHGQNTFDSIESVIADIRRGKMVIVVDDADRENEGDLIMAGACTSRRPPSISWPVRARVDLRAHHFRTPAATRHRPHGVKNRESFRTDFQVSVDAARGITTGISAADRARTIKSWPRRPPCRDDLVQPGHVFPLRAKPGGVLQRAGHTEAAVDLVKLAGCRPIGVLCEIMNDDGTMARLPQLIEIRPQTQAENLHHRRAHEYRRTREKLVERVEVVKMPTDYGDLICICIAPSWTASIISRSCAATWPGRKRCWCASTANV
jgi:3,4-dihydroxy 2-butanone 4-phosphate synthase / GTP cyclohydrolase II